MTDQQFKRVFNLPGVPLDELASTEFDWAAIEADVEADVEAIATGIVVEVLSFVFAFVFGGTATTQTAFRRFVALCYIVRPDLLGKSQANLAHELKVSKSEVARHVAAVRDELAIQGPFLIPVGKRLAIKGGQLQARRQILRGPAPRKKGSSRMYWANHQRKRR